MNRKSETLDSPEKPHKRQLLIAIMVVVVGVLAFQGYKAYNAPNMNAPALQDIRPDLRELLDALTYRIQGIELNRIGMGSGLVAFDEGIGSLADPTGLEYRHLHLQNILMERFEETDEKNRYELVATYHFADKMGKRAFVSVGVEYLVKDGVIYVLTAVVEPFFPTDGDILVTAVPSDKLPEFKELEEYSLEEIYLTMLGEAVPMNEIIKANPD